jgi:limonene 1,2-monooxygenase
MGTRSGLIARMTRLRFGIFMAPFHPAGENPTVALQRDLELIEHLDRLGYDEAWIGEHHSAGSEIIASPEIFIATAAERTRHIKLGTGVVSLAYHNPLWVTERMVLLDHLTRGRAMLGVGPGSLPTDSAMIGLTPTDTRELMDTNLDVVMRLLRGDEPVSVETPTHKLIRRAPAPTPVFRAAHGRRGRRGRVANGAAAGRSLRGRPALDRSDDDRGRL